MATKTQGRTLIQDAEEQRKAAWNHVSIALLTGIIALLIASWACESAFCSFWKQTGNGILLAVASFVIGGLGGFIFGVPTFLQDGNASLKYNDNFAQISDWLTKIIVGVGLTQLTKIPPKVTELGNALAPAFGNGQAGVVLSLCIVFYFLTLGFLSLYFWTRTDFTRILKLTDDDIREKLERLSEVEDVKKKLEFDKEKGKEKNLIKLSVQQEKVFKEVSERSREAEQIFVTPIIGPVTDAEDPQKNRFGGKSEANERRLSASIKKLAGDLLFELTLTVESTNPDNPILSPVIFFLHDTFDPSVYALYPKEFIDGKAIDNDIIAWGAFTVGIVTDNGATLLELDLSQIEDFPEDFKSR